MRVRFGKPRTAQRLTRELRQVAADPHPPAAKRSLKPKDGPFKEVWEKMEKNAKALSAAELRVFFLKEIKWVTPSQAGQLWVEFEEVSHG